MLKPLTPDYESDVETTLDRLLNDSLHDLQRQRVVPAIGTLNLGLRAIRDLVDGDFWKKKISAQVRAHPIVARLHESPLAARTFARPRGYPGDAVMIDYIYGCEKPLACTNLGKEIFEYELQVAGCSSVRLRRRIVQRRIEQLFLERPDAQVLSIAAGHLREIDETQLAQLGPGALILAIDQDMLSLERLRQRLSSPQIVPLGLRLRELLLHSVELNHFDFIYSMGLLDYLDRRTAASLVRYCVRQLKPGGQLLLANFSPSLFDSAYMESVMDWWLIYRDENEMIDLLRDVPPEQFHSYRVFRDHLQSVVYLEVTRTNQ